MMEKNNKLIKALVRGVMRRAFTRSWREIVDLISIDQNTAKQFTLGYIFQTIIHGIWMERNRKRHGEKFLNTTTLIRIMEKNIRNKFSSVHRMGYTKLEDELRFRFTTTPASSL